MPPTTRRDWPRGSAPSAPPLLADALASVEAFAGAYCSLQEDGIVMIIGVAGKDECAVLYPRKNELHAFFHGAAALDSRRLKEELTLRRVGTCITGSD